VWLQVFTCPWPRGTKMEPARQSIGSGSG
jgi:hypothetical protein